MRSFTRKLTATLSVAKRQVGMGVALTVWTVDCWAQAEEAARTQMEYDDDFVGNTGLKKTPSEASCTSVELYIPRRRGDSNGNVGPNVMIDKECLSMKSDCGMDNRRRFSIVNATGKKVQVKDGRLKYVDVDVEKLPSACRCVPARVTNTEPTCY